MQDITSKEEQHEVAKLQIGDHVFTPGGIGVVHEIVDDHVIVEMDYTYLVVYSIQQVQLYK